MADQYPYLFTGAQNGNAGSQGDSNGWPFFSVTSPYSAGIQSMLPMQSLPGLGSYSDLPGLGDALQSDGPSQTGPPPASQATINNPWINASFETSAGSAFGSQPSQTSSSAPVLQQKPPTDSQATRQLPPIPSSAGLPPRPPSVRSPSLSQEEGEVDENDKGNKMDIDRVTTAQPPPQASQVPVTQLPGLASAARSNGIGNTAPVNGVAPKPLMHTHQQTGGKMRQQGDRSRARAKSFVQVMHDAGITFQQLASEGLDTEVLHGIYDELRIQVDEPVRKAARKTPPSSDPHASQQPTFDHAYPHMSASTKPNPISSAAADKGKDVIIDRGGQQDIKSTPSSAAADVVSTGRISPLTPKAPTSQTKAPKDRNEYIARLMAAKSKTAVTTEATQNTSAASSSSTLKPQATKPSGVPKSSASSMNAGSSRNALVPGTDGTATDKAGEKKAKLAQLRAQALKTAKERRLEKERQSKNDNVQIIPPPASETPAAFTTPDESSTETGPKVVENSPTEHRAITTASSSSSQPTNWLTNVDDLRGRKLSLSDSTYGITGATSGLVGQPSSSSASVKPTFGQPSPLLSGNPSQSNEAATKTIPSSAAKRLAEPLKRDTSTVSQNKRRFGTPRNSYPDDECIIVASEDEAGDEMDAEDTPEGSVQVETQVDGSCERPPSTTASSRPTSNDLDQHGSTLGSVTSGKALNTANKPEEKSLSLHERQILEMKKRIELIEQRKKKKLEKSNPEVKTQRTEKPQLSSNGAQGTQAVEGDRPSSKDEDTAMPEVPTIEEDKHGVRTGNQSSIDSVVTQPGIPTDREDQQTSIESPSLRESECESQTVTAGKSYDTKSEPSPATNMETDWRKQRRAALEASLDDRKNAAQSTMSKIERLRMEMRELEEAAQREQEARDRLTAELEELGIDTEHIADEDLQQMRDDVVARAAAKEDEAQSASNTMTGETDRQTPNAKPLSESSTGGMNDSSSELRDKTRDLTSDLLKTHTINDESGVPPDPTPDFSGSSSMDESRDSSRRISAISSSNDGVDLMSQEIEDKLRSPHEMSEDADTKASDAILNNRDLPESEESPSIQATITEMQADGADSMEIDNEDDDDAYEPQDMLPNSITPASHDVPAPPNVEMSDGEIAEDNDKKDGNTPGSHASESHPSLFDNDDDSEDYEPEEYEPPKSATINSTKSVRDIEDADQDNDEPKLNDATDASTSQASSQPLHFQLSSDGPASGGAARSATVKEVDVRTA